MKIVFVVTGWGNNLFVFFFSFSNLRSIENRYSEKVQSGLRIQNGVGASIAVQRSTSLYLTLFSFGYNRPFIYLFVYLFIYN